MYREELARLAAAFDFMTPLQIGIHVASAETLASGQRPMRPTRAKLTLVTCSAPTLAIGQLSGIL